MGKIVDAVVNVVSSVFGGGNEQQPAPAPVVASPTPMPTPDDEAARAAKKKSIAAITARQGRASTILSDSSNDSLGV